MVNGPHGFKVYIQHRNLQKKTHLDTYLDNTHKQQPGKKQTLNKLYTLTYTRKFRKNRGYSTDTHKLIAKITFKPTNTN